MYGHTNGCQALVYTTTSSTSTRNNGKTTTVQDLNCKIYSKTSIIFILII